MGIARGNRPGWVIQFTLAVAFSAALIDAAAASPTVVAVVSDPATWFESTVTATDDTFPGWPGVGAVPPAGTFTTATVAGAAHVDNVTGSTNLVAGSGVRFFRTTFFLPTFSSLIANLQVSVDNDVQVFINAAGLALEGSLSTDNFSNGIHHGLFIDSTGDVTNGGDAFDSFTDPFPSGNWVGGDNEVILAVRNLSGGDAGGFSFRLDVATTPVGAPVPALLLLVISGLVGLGALRRRRGGR